MQGEGERKDGKKKEEMGRKGKRGEKRENRGKREKKDCFLNWATDYLEALEQVI